jgi:hypothetical protein
MSATIPIRVAGGQVLQVPPLRLAWASTRPRLIELMDVVGAMQQGTWPGDQAATLAVCAEFLAEVAKAAAYTGPELDADVADCVVIRMALRGCPPDPTRASAAE